MGYVSHIYSFCASSIFALYWITYGTEFTSGRHLTNNGVSVKWETTVKNKEALTARGITSCLHVPFMLKARTIWKHRKTRNKFAISYEYLFHRIQGQFDSINTSPVRPLHSSQCQEFLMVQAKSTIFRHNLTPCWRKDSWLWWTCSFWLKYFNMF